MVLFRLHGRVLGGRSDGAYLLPSRAPYKVRYIYVFRYDYTPAGVRVALLPDAAGWGLAVHAGLYTCSARRVACVVSSPRAV